MERKIIPGEINIHDETVQLHKRIADLVHQQGLLTPTEVINDYIINRRGNPLYEFGLHPQPALVHTFMDWCDASWRAVPAVDPWMGRDNEKVKFDDRQKILFDLFCMELKRRGVDLTDEVKEETWKAYLDD